VVSPAFVLIVALIWPLVALGRLIRLAIDFRELAAIRRESSLRSHAYDFPIYESNRVRVPIAIGFANPAVILPATLFEHVDERGVEAILIHETAHLRRYDVWTNVFAQVIQALLALNPVSWFVAREISTQREIACDDWVVARTHWSEAFVRALTSMADGRRTRMPVAAPSALGSRRVIIQRVEQLLDDARQRNLHFSRVSLSVAGVLLTLIAFTLQALSPALAFQPPADTPAQHSGITLALSCTQRDRNGGPFRAHTYGPGGREWAPPRWMTTPCKGW